MKSGHKSQGKKCSKVCSAADSSNVPAEQGGEHNLNKDSAISVSKTIILKNNIR